MDNNIWVQNLCKQFEDFSLDNVSFKVPKGRIVGFIGENGAGKRTTINLKLKELNKDSGQILVFGIDHTIPTIKENIGVVFDECNFHDEFTTADIEKILKGVYKTWDSNLFSQYLKKFKIPTKKTISAFSRGILRYIEQACNHYIAFKVLAHIRHLVFEKLRELAPAKLENEDKGNIIEESKNDKRGHCSHSSATFKSRVWF